MPKPPHRRHVPSSAIASFIDPERLSKLLQPWLPNADDRDFVLRCILDEGPAHHRGANWVVLALLGELLERVGGAAAAAEEPSVAVPMRLPPHLHREDQDGGDYPLRIPTRAIETLAPRGSPTFEAMIDCLTDGPPQHALANAAVVCVISRLLERVPKQAG
jgi:hypothetical protein